MLISHHPPSQYNRTFCFLHIRFCARCTGILVGVISSSLFLQSIKFNLISGLIAGLILPLPAILNFTFSELGKLKNNNFRRITSGTLLGFSIGIALNNLISGSFIAGLIIVIWIFLLEIAVAVILHKRNVLDKFMKQYEDGIYKE